MKIIVCSKNKAKNKAVEKILKQFFNDYEVISLDTKSGVSETPIGDDEGIKGCINRITDAIKQNNTGYLYIAMEGILNINHYGTFLCGWTVIYNNRDDEYYYGCSSKVRIPDDIAKKIDKDIRLSEIVAKYTNSDDELVSIIGTNGILTNGVYTRTDEFMDSVICALSTKFKKEGRKNEI